jgi:hypothetical protein
MTTKTITASDSSFLIESKMVDSWDPSASVTVTITDKAGTTLVNAQAATQYAGDTLAASSAAGTFTITLTTGTALEQGDLIVIGSDSIGWQKREVDGYVASTKVVTLLTGLDEALPVGAAVYGLDLGYTVDTTATGWDGLTQVEVIWTPDTDDLPFTELWEVRTFRTAVAGFEDEFRAAFNSLYTEINPEDFPKFEDRARDRLKQEFEYMGRNFELIVDSQLIREIMIIEIALLIGRATHMDEAQYERLTADRQHQLDILNNLEIWIDDNEDNIEDEEETKPADEWYFRQRGIF